MFLAVASIFGACQTCCRFYRILKFTLCSSVQIVFFVVLITVWGVWSRWVKVVKYSGACIYKLHSLLIPSVYVHLLYTLYKLLAVSSLLDNMMNRVK